MKIFTFQSKLINQKHGEFVKSIQIKKYENILQEHDTKNDEKLESSQKNNRNPIGNQRIGRWNNRNVDALIGMISSADRFIEPMGAELPIPPNIRLSHLKSIQPPDRTPTTTTTTATSYLKTPSIHPLQCNQLLVGFNCKFGRCGRFSPSPPPPASSGVQVELKRKGERESHRRHLFHISIVDPQSKESIKMNYSDVTGQLTEQHVKQGR